MYSLCLQGLGDQGDRWSWTRSQQELCSMCQGRSAEESAQSPLRTLGVCVTHRVKQSHRRDETLSSQMLREATPPSGLAKKQCSLCSPVSQRSEMPGVREREKEGREILRASWIGTPPPLVLTSSSGNPYNIDQHSSATQRNYPLTLASTVLCGRDSTVSLQDINLKGGP